MPTYLFNEIIDRIKNAETEELLLLAELINEEKNEYSLFDLKLITEAVQIKRISLQQIDKS